MHKKANFKFKKAVFETRLYFVVMAALFMLFFSLTSHAFDHANPFELEDTCSAENPIAETEVLKKTVFKKGYNAVYRFINDHEYLFAPLSGAIAGEIRCGAWCAAAGGALGAIDEALIYFGVTDKHYLTWGIFGIATGHVIKPSVASDMAGVAVGILLPTGALNGKSELIAPVISAVAGSSMPTMGLTKGLAAGIFDEVAIYDGITDKHYMTWCTVGMAATNLLGIFNPAVADFIGIIVGSIAAEYEENFSASLMAPVRTTENLYDIYGKFIPKEQLNSHIEKHSLALIGSQFMVQYLTLKSAGFRQNLNYNFERLDNPAGPAWGNFKSETINFAIFLFPYVIGQTVSGRIDSYFCKKLQYAVEDEIRTELYSGEVALRLSHDQSTTVAIDNLRSDVSTITESGSGLITGAVSASIGGIYGVGIVVVNSPNLFIYSTLYNQAQLFIANILATQQRVYGEKIRVLDSELVSIIKHDTENIRTITERDGVEYTKERLKQLYETSREYEANQELWSSANSLWWSMSGMANFMSNHFLIGHEINRGRIPFDNRNKVLTAGWQVSDLLSWPGHNAQFVASIDQSLDRIVVLEGKIHARPANKDQIERTAYDGKQLILQDLEVGVGNRLLVAVEELRLDMGRTYAVTGETGSGKTSLLSKIKGIKENGIAGKGSIYYPLVNGREPKIVVVSQQEYFPVESSLQEAILYPDKAPSDPVLSSATREEVRLLLEEIGLGAFSGPGVTDTNTKDKSKTKRTSKGGLKKTKEKEGERSLDLDSVQDWYTVLSGGEKKKVLLVSAFIKKPDILILDEVFAGLDANSIIVVQQMLKKHLPDALILVVDHHAQDNNHEAFYDKELNFSDKGIVLQDISSKTH
jgi:ABC-type multidrug transport system ATPase subunit